MEAASKNHAYFQKQSRLEHMARVCGESFVEPVNAFLDDPTRMLQLDLSQFSDSVCLRSLNNLFNSPLYRDKVKADKAAVAVHITNIEDVDKLRFLDNYRFGIKFEGDNAYSYELNDQFFERLSRYSKSIISLHVGDMLITDTIVSGLKTIISVPDSSVNELLMGHLLFPNFETFERLTGIMKSPYCNVDKFAFDKLRMEGNAAEEYPRLGDAMVKSVAGILMAHPGRSWRISLSENGLTHKSIAELRKASEHMAKENGGLKITELILARNNLDPVALFHLSDLLDMYDWQIGALDLSGNPLLKGPGGNLGFKTLLKTLSYQKRFELIKVIDVEGFGDDDAKAIAELLNARNGKIVNLNRVRTGQ